MEKIIKGDDTFFNGQELLSKIIFDTNIDLTGFKATFSLSNVLLSFDDITNGVQPSFTKEQTSQMMIGENLATLVIYDTQEKKHTEFTQLPYKITSNKEVLYAE